MFKSLIIISTLTLFFTGCSKNEVAQCVDTLDATSVVVSKENKAKIKEACQSIKNRDHTDKILVCLQDSIEQTKNNLVQDTLYHLAKICELGTTHGHSLNELLNWFSWKPFPKNYEVFEKEMIARNGKTYNPYEIRFKTKKKK